MQDAHNASPRRSVVATAFDEGQEMSNVAGCYQGRARTKGQQQHGH